MFGIFLDYMKFLFTSTVPGGTELGESLIKSKREKLHTQGPLTTSIF